jgi:hypothetical protein
MVRREIRTGFPPAQIGGQAYAGTRSSSPEGMTTCHNGFVIPATILQILMPALAIRQTRVQGEDVRGQALRARARPGAGGVRCHTIHGSITDGQFECKDMIIHIPVHILSRS